MGAGLNCDAYNEMATETLELHAVAGDPEAQFQLGFRHFSGRGAVKDEKAAFALWRKAGEAGHPLAQNNLGMLYASGTGTMQNTKLAFLWYRKAANQGLDMAELNVGNMCENGQGTTKDAKAAQAWYEKAAAQGNEEAAALLDAMANTVSPKKNLVIFLLVLGIIPWAMFYMSVLAPTVDHLFGIDKMSKVKLAWYLLPILLPPALLIGFVTRKP